MNDEPLAVINFYRSNFLPTLRELNDAKKAYREVHQKYTEMYNKLSLKDRKIVKDYKVDDAGKNPMV